MDTFQEKLKGLSLVELIVVIGIIGALLLIILPSLTGTKQAARDKAAIIAMNELRVEADKVYALDNDYDNVKCAAGNATIAQICASVNDRLNPNTITIVPSATTSANKYCAYAKLLTKKSGSDNYYCVDSTGNSTETTTNPASNKCRSGWFTCL